MGWLKVTLLLCVYGFFMEFGSMTEYLSLEISRYDIWIKICNLLILAVIAFVADKIRYLWMLAAMSLMSGIAWVLFFWIPHNHGHMVALVLYEILKHFKIPYFAYIFAKVSKDRFSSVSSLTHAAVFAGSFLGAVCVELIIDGSISDQAIFYCIFIAQMFAIYIAVSSPKLDRMPSPMNLSNHCNWIVEQLKFACTNYRIIIWSGWFIAGTVMMNQFNELFPTLETTLLNRPIQWKEYEINLIWILCEFLGILLTILTCFIFLRTKRHALSILIAASWGSGVLMILIANAYDPHTLYIPAEILIIIFKVTITISSAEIANQIQDDSYALVFATNTFIAMFFQLILSAAAQPQQIDPISWTRIYGGIYVFIGFVYGVLTLISFTSHPNNTVNRT